MANLYTDVELAQRFGVTVSTVRRWRGDGTGPAHIIIGTGTVRYREEDILAYESRAVTGGEIPPRAMNALSRASDVLGAVLSWKMSDQKRDVISGIREEVLNVIDERKTA